MLRLSRGSLSLLVVGGAAIGCDRDHQGDALGPVAPSDVAAPASSIAPNLIRNRFIILLKDSVTRPNERASAIAAEAGAQVLNTLIGIKGFTIGNVSDLALSHLRGHPSVESVNPEVLERLEATQILPSSDAQWGLDQIDQVGGTRNL